MVSPNVARDLTPRGGSVFAPAAGAGGWPLLRGSVSDPDTADANLTVYARLWSPNGKWIWTRQMAAQSGGYFTYQTVGPGTSEVKQWVFGSGITGGTWAFRYHNVDSDPLWWGATNANIAARLANHPDLQAGQFDVTWNGSTRTLTVTFKSDRGGINIDSLGIVNQTTGSGDLSISGSTTTNGTGDFPTSDGGRGHFSWDMIAFDGTTYAGGTTVQRMADAPARADFWVDDPVVITMVKPLANVETTIPGTMPAFEWTVSNIGKVPVRQQFIRIVNDATNEIVDIDEDGRGSWIDETGAARTYRLPWNRITGNGTRWRWNLNVAAASGLAANAYGTLSLQYATPPAPTALTAALGGGASRVVYLDLNWEIGIDSGFIDQLIRIRPAGAAPRGADDRIIWRSADSTIRGQRVLDYALNLDQIASVSQRAYRSGEIVESPPREVTFSPAWHGIILSENEFPRLFLEIPYHAGRSIEGTRASEYVEVLNRRAPLEVTTGIGKPFALAISAMPDARPYPDGPATFWETVQTFYANERKRSFLYRDATRQRTYVSVDRPRLDYPAGGTSPTIEIPLREIDYRPVSLEVA